MANSVWSPALQEAADGRAALRLGGLPALPLRHRVLGRRGAAGAHGARPLRARRAPRLARGGARHARRARRGACSTRPGEGRLLERLAPAADARLVSVGYDDVPPPDAAAVDAFCAARGIAPGYLLYAGRREKGKGLGELYEDYARYVWERPDVPPLALMGSGSLAPPDEIAGRVIDLGFVPDAERDAAYAAASVLLHPSRLESLGMVLLEAWLCGTPALVNARSPVLREHCEGSGGGLWYADCDGARGGPRHAARRPWPARPDRRGRARLHARDLLVARGAAAILRRARGVVVSAGVHQVLAGAAPRDAITHHALAAQDLLRGRGLRSEIFVEDGHIHPGLGGRVRPASAWDAHARPARRGDPPLLHRERRVRPRRGALRPVRDPLPQHHASRAALAVRAPDRPRVRQGAAGAARRSSAGCAAVGADSAYNAHELAALGFPDPAVLGILRPPLPAAPAAPRATGGRDADPLRRARGAEQGPAPPRAGGRRALRRGARPRVGAGRNLGRGARLRGPTAAGWPTTSRSQTGCDSRAR